MEMEKPTIDPATGKPLWRANGERQRYYDRMFAEVDHGALLVVAGQVLRHRAVKRGEIGPHDGISPSFEEMADVIEWADLRQLRILRKCAESLGEPEVISTH
jgi:hypothetical protein